MSASNYMQFAINAVFVAVTAELIAERIFYVMLAPFTAIFALGLYADRVDALRRAERHRLVEFSKWRSPLTQIPDQPVDHPAQQLGRR